MNETLGSRSTVATIDGTKETLVFGARYDVRYGEDSVVRDAILHERAANGDLVFLVGYEDGSGRRRIRPSTIDAIVLRTSPRGDGEGAAAYLARLERELGVGYNGWIATEAGQSALRAAATEASSARNGKSRKADPTKVVDVLATILPGVVGKVSPLRESEPPPVPSEADIAELAALNASDRAKTKGRPYAERNQVWKCGTCKRRTRQPVCENGHAPVAAPAGKRRDDR